MTFYRNDPEPRRHDVRVAVETFPCANCDLPIKAGDAMRLHWYGWAHEPGCMTEVGE